MPAPPSSPRVMLRCIPLQPLPILLKKLPDLPQFLFRRHLLFRRQSLGHQQGGVQNGVAGQQAAPPLQPVQDGLLRELGLLLPEEGAGHRAHDTQLFLVIGAVDGRQGDVLLIVGDAAEGGDLVEESPGALLQLVVEEHQGLGTEVFFQDLQVVVEGGVFDLPQAPVVLHVKELIERQEAAVLDVAPVLGGHPAVVPPEDDDGAGVG